MLVKSTACFCVVTVVVAATCGTVYIRWTCETVTGCATVYTLLTYCTVVGTLTTIH